MVIGFDASRAFIKNKTGTENYSFQILLHLLRIDSNNLYYIYIRPGISKSLIESCLSRYKIPNTRYKILAVPFPRLWTQAGLAIQTFKDPLDVLFIPAHILPLIRKPGLKTVVTVHDLGASYLPKAHQLKQRLYLKLMTDYQLKSATHIIAVSESTKEDLIKKVGIDPYKVTVVYEGFNQELFQPLKNDELINRLIQYDLTTQQYFLFVGTIQPRKNLERLIKAYALFLKASSQIHQSSSINHQSLPSLVLAGSKGWLSDDIYKLPYKLGIEGKVKFLGFVTDKDLPYLYSGARAFLFPSLFEGFGLPILEAFACSCPVLTSNISSMPEVAGSAAVLINPLSVEDISTGISKIYNHPPQIKLGLKQLQKFSWEKAAQQTLEILEKTGKRY